MSDEARAVPVEGDRERPYTAEIGANALVRRADGSLINFGDALYHPDYVAEARAYAAGVSLTGSGLDVERLARAQVRSGIDTFLPGEDRWISANEAQAAIAREYAAISGESGERARVRAAQANAGLRTLADEPSDPTFPDRVGESGEPKPFRCPHVPSCCPLDPDSAPYHEAEESGEPKETERL